jgi:hypothetical protein
MGSGGWEGRGEGEGKGGEGEGEERGIGGEEGDGMGSLIS